MEDSNNITPPENIEEIEEIPLASPEENTSEDLRQTDDTYAKAPLDNPFEDVSQNDAPAITDFSRNITSDTDDSLFYYEEDRTDEINKYTKFKKVDGATYRKVNLFLRKRTYITAREWAIARLCSDFKTPYGSEMTFIGNHLPELCPFMEEPYSAQAVNQARTSFKRKVRKSGATFFYGAMCGFFTPDELDDILFESSEIAKFLLEIEGTNLEIDDEIDIEDKISDIMRRLGESASIMLSSRRGSSGDSSDDDDDEDVVEVEVYGGKAEDAAVDEVDESEVSESTKNIGQ